MEFGKWGELIEVFLAKNSQINLSAIRDADGVYVKHILDSLELLKIFAFEEGQTVCDLGTGGGFPLLPLAIENPGVQFVGMDARKKKLQAISEMIESLQGSMVSGEGSMVLENVDLVWSRVEEYNNIVISSEVERSHISEKEISLLRSLHSLQSKGHSFGLPKKFDVVMARAVAHVEVLIPWMMQIVKKGGKLVLYKEYKEEEKKILDGLCQKYRLVIEKEHKYMLEDGGIERVIYILG